MKKLFGLCIRRESLAIVVLALATQYLDGQTFDLSKDFSATNNPAGNWSYGFRVPGNEFQRHTNNFEAITLNVWNHPSSAYSDIAHNATTSIVHPSSTNILWMPNETSMHSARNGVLTIIRFTAPLAGTYYLAARFQGIDHETLPTGIFVLVNNQVIYADVTVKYAYRIPHNCTRTLSLQQGDAVDFAVDQGPDGMIDDSTIAIEATLTAIPPSGTLPVPAVTLMTGGGLEWQSVPGINYQVQRSVGLEAWDAVGVPILGDGTVKTVIVPLTPPLPTFLRIRVERP